MYYIVYFCFLFKRVGDILVTLCLCVPQTTLCWNYGQVTVSTCNNNGEF